MFNRSDDDKESDEEGVGRSEELSGEGGKKAALFRKNVRLRIDGIKGMVWDLLGEMDREG